MMIYTKHIKTAIFLTGLLLLSFTGYTSEPFTTYTGQNQLNTIYDIAIDGDFVWCATEGGVVRWDMIDGTYTVYTHDDGLINNRVYSVFVDRNHIVWIGTSKGLSIIHAGQWTSHESIDFGSSHSWTTISSIVTDLQGQMWFNSQYSAIISFNGIDWNTVTSDDGMARGDVMSMAIDSNDGIWTGHKAQSRYSGERGGISHFDGSTWKQYEHNDGLGGFGVYAVAVDRTDTKWFASREVDGIGTNSISKFDGKTWTTYTTDDGLVSNLVNTICVDDNNNKWFGTDNGVSIYNESQWATITVSDGLCDNNVSKIKSDSSGNMYFGTSNGLSIKKGNIWLTLKVADGLPYGSISAMAVDNNGVKWFATCDRSQNSYRPLKEHWRNMGYGIIRFDGETWIIYTEDDGLVNNTVRDIAVDHDNNIWFATPFGISRFDGTTWETFTEFDGIECNDVYSIAVEKGSILWFGTYNGVSRYDGSNWKNYHVQDRYGYDCSVTDIAIDANGVKWFAIYEEVEHPGGVVSFDNENWTLYSGQDNIIDSEVYSIAADIDNNVWFGTDNILARYDGKTWYHYYHQQMSKLTNFGWQVVGEDTITPSGTIQCIAVEPNGVKWISTYAKLYRYTGDSVEEYDINFLPG